MKLPFRLFFKSIVAAVMVLKVFLFIGSCFFDTSLPLQNDCPLIDSIINPGLSISPSSRPTLFRSLRYPESLVCVLTVSDMNDKELEFVSLQWPGYCVQKNYGYSKKIFEIYFTSPIIGQDFSGEWIFRDLAGATDTLLYKVNRQFIHTLDSIDEVLQYWSPYSPLMLGSMIEAYKYSPLEYGLVFNFKQGDMPGFTYTGLSSRFRLAGDFSCSITYKMRESIADGFLVDFFVSTSPLWPSDGDETGVSVTKKDGQFYATIRSTTSGDNTTVRQPSYFSYGTFKIERIDSVVSIYQISWDAANPSMKKLLEPMLYVSDTVNVHMNMSVDDFAHNRRCIWANFTIEKGTVIN